MMHTLQAVHIETIIDAVLYLNGELLSKRRQLDSQYCVAFGLGRGR